MNSGAVMHTVEQFISTLETIPTAHVFGLVVSVIAVVTVVYVLVKRRKSLSALSHCDRMESLRKGSSRAAADAGAPSTRSKNNQTSATPSGTTFSLPATASSSSSSAAVADCAWEQRRRRGIAAHSLHEKKDAGNEKPFGSSYYYAHNNTRATGGYKDGLTMEDFTMNGPRLLSRGGKPVSSDGIAREYDSPEDWENDIDKTESTSQVTDEKKRAPSLKRSIPISRYLWDDPGDAKKGIATIRIEELPGKRSTDPMIPWKDVSITKINAELLGEEDGLLVTIETATDVDYELRIPKLYGQVAELEAITKPKRLLLRLKKKADFLNKSNLRAWPHPQKKTS